jgi:hypothetical protein
MTQNVGLSQLSSSLFESLVIPPEDDRAALNVTTIDHVKMATGRREETIEW